MSTNHASGKILFLLFLLSLPSFIRLIRPGFFSMQDDVQAFRLFEFDKCVRTLQIPCRWIPDGGAGYGYPLFNYYPPLPYAAGEVLHLAGLSVIDSLKALFVFGFLLSALAMFFLVGTIWGETAGLLSAVFYLYAPYRSVDSFVRGDISEFLALAIAPLVLLGIYRCIYRQKLGLIIFVASLASLILTHLLSLLMLAPLATVWTIYWLWRKKSFQSVKELLFGTILSLGISSFSWLPSLAERNLVTLNTITQGYFDFRGHFASLNQLFLSRFWGYGASLFQRSDLSLSIGHLQWLIPTVIAALAVLLRKKKVVNDPFFFLSLAVGFFYAFMAHNQSTSIWLALPFLAYLQFPWRFVGFSVLAFTIAIGAINIKPRWLLLLLILAVIAVNAGYFKEDIWYPHMTDTEKLSPQAIAIQNISGLKDYWPNFGSEFPTHQAPPLPVFIHGAGSVAKIGSTGNGFAYQVVAASDSTLEIPVVYFPNWIAMNVATGRGVPIKITQPLGLISVDLQKGENNIYFELEDTPVRTLSNIISAVSVTILMVFVLIFKERRINVTVK